MCKDGLIGTEYSCPICGSLFINKNRGRAKEYCSDNCRNFNKYLNAMERELLLIKGFNGYSPNKVKGSILRVANLIKCKSRVANFTQKINCDSTVSIL